MAKLKLAHGNWVKGDRFWGRKKDLELFTQRIEEGAHILLTAQRRMGKTSLMREAERVLAGSYVCLFVDLQKARSAADAVVEIALALKPYDKLWRKAKKVFGNVIQKAIAKIEKASIRELSITLRSGLTRGDWAEKGSDLFSVLATFSQPVVLFIDELPIMINRMLKGDEFVITPERRQNADEFLSWLRHNSIQHKGQIRIVVSGSIGLEPILHQAGLSASITTFAPFELKPWDEPTAVGCLQALANEYGVCLAGEAAAAMVNRLGCCIPHHVQMFFAGVRDRCVRAGRMEFSADDVEDVYNNHMLSTRGHAELTHYEERLAMVLGKERFWLALDMLTEAAVTGCLTPEALAAIRQDHGSEDIELAQRDILSVLEHDGYLQPAHGGYAFVSSLVRDWWTKRYKLLYTPVMKRRR